MPVFRVRPYEGVEGMPWVEEINDTSLFPTQYEAAYHALALCEKELEFAEEKVKMLKKREAELRKMMEDA